MSDDDLTLDPAAFQTWLIKGIFEATRPPEETEADSRIRIAGIIAMFNEYEPNSTREAMRAAYAVTLHFQLLIAMKEVPEAVDPKDLKSARATVATMARTLRSFEKDLETARAAREKQEADASGHPPPPRKSPDRAAGANRHDVHRRPGSSSVDQAEARFYDLPT